MKVKKSFLVSILNMTDFYLKPEVLYCFIRKKSENPDIKATLGN